MKRVKLYRGHGCDSVGGTPASRTRDLVLREAAAIARKPENGWCDPSRVAECGGRISQCLCRKEAAQHLGVSER